MGLAVSGPSWVYLSLYGVSWVAADVSSCTPIRASISGGRAGIWTLAGDRLIGTDGHFGLTEKEKKCRAYNEYDRQKKKALLIKHDPISGG